ncbi:MAG: YgiT-type zinc finger protein [Spirochaetota bacterium]|nr:YgiT-type zinc finger protein [Spirochaetota bacterium]
MQCHCGNKMTKGRSSYRISKDNLCLIIDNIPAYKCHKCDNILFSSKIIEKIDKLVNIAEKEVYEITIGKNTCL